MDGRQRVARVRVIMSRKPRLNVNVGILGHVDSGKTSLARAISETFSTASLDRAPQSAQRGITLDLGFSSFLADFPPGSDAALTEAYDGVQFTLVDCPGHASLIKTVLGGASIIDLMILVVDANKGVQTQTSECIVVGEITTDRLVVALNKIDAFEESAREEKVAKIQAKLATVFAKTKFKGCAILPVSARPGGADSQALDSSGTPPIGIEALKSTLLDVIPEVKRKRDGGGAFLFAVDHCFPVKGQGTVLTGTTLRGGIKVGDTIEIPHLKLEKKIKSMQMFKKPVDSCARGDRLGICIAGLDADALERGLVCEPGTVPTFNAAIVSARKIRFFKGTIKCGSKFHVTIGHTTVMASVQFFGNVPKENQTALADAMASMTLAEVPFDLSKEYKYCDELLTQAEANELIGNSAPSNAFDAPAFATYALLEFEHPITVPTDELYIASRFDTDIHANTCRLAFHGKLLHHMNTERDPSAFRSLRVFKMKSREGSIERVQDERTVIGKGMFKKESDLTSFVGMKVWTSNNECGVIEGGFGKSGKYKVYFSNGIKSEGDGKLVLRFKKYIFERDAPKMQQTGM